MPSSNSRSDSRPSSRPALSIVLVIIGLVIGAAIGYFVGIASAEDSGEPSDLRARIAHALKTLPPIEREVGDGTITGKVTDRDTKAPSAGILIEARGHRHKARVPNPPYFNGEPESAPDLVGMLSMVVEAQTEYHALYYYTRTDAEGNYELTGLPDVTYSVFASAVGYKATFGHDDQGNDENPLVVRIGSTINFHVSREWQVKVVVLKPDGTLAPECSLSTKNLGIDRNYSSSVFRWSPPFDYVPLIPGKHEVTAFFEDRKESSERGVVVVEIGEEQPSDLTIKLKATDAGPEKQEPSR